MKKFWLREGFKLLIAETDIDGVSSQKILIRCGFKEYERNDTVWWRLKTPVCRTDKLEVVKENIVLLNIADTFELLFDKNNNVAYKALQELQKESKETDLIYPYMDRLSDMLDSDNSYIRTRGLTLLAYNAKWDKDYKIDEIIDKYLKHIIDVKPITARQCIKLLPIIAKYKPELQKDILSALHKADISVYDDSMQPLVYKDIQKALKEIQKL